MPILNDPRLDPMDINASDEYFPPVTTPDVMALHMARQWKHVHPTVAASQLDAIYAMWLKAYQQVDRWHDQHPSATADEARVEAEHIFARVCHEFGIPLRGTQRAAEVEHHRLGDRA